MKTFKTVDTGHGYEKVVCHMCGVECFIRGGDGLGSMFRHITCQAKTEALKKELGDKGKTPHLNFYLANTQRKVMPEIMEREFTGNITVDK